jgi:hypothetical protein
VSQIRHTVLAQPTQPWDYIPLPTAVGNKLLIDQRDHEDFKRRLKGLPPDDSPRGPIKFMPISLAAAEIGAHPKTYKKWIRLRMLREAGKPTPAPERTSTIVKRNRPKPLAKRSTRALETV